MAGLKSPISQAGPDVRKIARQLEKGLSGDTKRTIEKAAMAAKLVHNAEIAKVAGADMRLSGVNRAKGRKGNVRVGTQYKVKQQGYAMADGFIKATGPMQLIERDTSGHVIRSAYAKGRGRRGLIGPTTSASFSGGGWGSKAVLNIPGIGFRKSARHPGTKGQEPWAKGYKRAKPVIGKIIHKRTYETVKKNKGP